MIVGFAGLAGAGKNEAAKALPFPQIGFADSIKEIVISLDPVISFHPASGLIHLTSLLQYESFELIKRYSPELRRLLQELGMAMRDRNEEFWIDQVWDKLADRGDKFKWDKVVGKYENACITDVRFQNEIDFVHEMPPGFVIWIERPGVIQSSHPSENSITAEDCDGYVLNNGTIKELHEKVRGEVAALLKNWEEQ